MENINVDRLHRKSSRGLQVKKFDPTRKVYDKPGAGEPHRDDHFIFFVLISGSAKVKIELGEVTLSAGELFYILPNQVHYHIEPVQIDGFFLAVDPSLIPPPCKKILERSTEVQQPRKQESSLFQQQIQLLDLLYAKYRESAEGLFQNAVIYALLQSFLFMAAETYSETGHQARGGQRSAEIAAQFKDLLSIHFKTIKSAAIYAEKLNITESYLNQVLREATGLSVSYWIQQQTLQEAKRLLHYTNLSIKEIASSLGYEDHSYFSRFFRKAAGMTAQNFRKMYYSC